MDYSFKATSPPPLTTVVTRASIATTNLPESLTSSRDDSSSYPNTVEEHWNPAKHTVSFPTDAYGYIDFRGGAQTNKAQYIRLGYDTKSDLVLALLLREWGLEKPKLLISVNGGKANFDLQPKLKRTLRKGLLKAAKTSGAWIFTGGTNNGVTKHVGDALITEKSPRIKGDRVVSIGIAPWGILENRRELIGRKKENPVHTMPHSRSDNPRFASLNKNHAYFLLVDNGTVGKYGAEIALRRKLEKYISTQKLGNDSQLLRDFCTPLVCLVIEGGTNTIRAVLEYVTDTPPVPVVVCDGTGRAADLLAFAHKYAGENGEPGLLDSQMAEQLKLTIQKTFRVSAEQAYRLHLELSQCVKRKNLITVFRCTGDSGEETELDQVILTALFKSQQLSPMEQLSLALSWNRSDIAKKEIFSYGHEWPRGALEEAMQDALLNNRVNFVRLLLENGVNMHKFLTMRRLEDLYNSKNGPANTLEYLVRDVVPRMSKHYRFTLLDIGNVINQLMGGGYRANYTQRAFRLRYELMLNTPLPTSAASPHKLTAGVKTLKKSLTSTTLKVPQFLLARNSTSVLTGSQNDDLLNSIGFCFDHPFTELIIWAALTKRQDMALLMWEHGEQAMAKSLLVCRLYQAMAYEAADDDLDVEIFDELKNDDDLTQHLLTASLSDFSRQTCLRLSDIGNHLRFLSHPLCQTILADLWMGGLRMRKNPGFKIVLGLLFPPTIVKLEFKTREELELMPQTEEEHEQDAESNSSSNSSSSTSSRRSSIHINEIIISGSQRSLEMGGLLNIGTLRPDIDVVDTTEMGTGHLLKEHSKMDLCRKKTRPLKWKKKLYEFYAAPITKFYCHSIAYMIFLVFYTYVCLVKTPLRPSWAEIYVVACMISFGSEKIRQILVAEPSGFFQKLKVWFLDTRWNLVDSIAIIIFLIAFSLRLYDPYFFLTTAHVTYSTDICYWYIRSLKLLSVNKYFGPFVMMMGKMIENMIYFVVLLLVVLMAFGVCRQAILHPNEDPDWILIRHIFFQPYFMLYGEVFAPDINPEFANILLINLLIALFNTIYNSVNAISHQLWNFQRFAVVMEYEEKPVLPAPLILLSHIHRIGKYVYRRCRGDKQVFESGLKLFLSKYDIERLYDFEEECVEGYLREIEAGSRISNEHRIKNVQEMSEEIKNKMKELHQWHRQPNFEYRLQRIEEVCEQTANHLAVIHRFMAMQQQMPDSPVHAEENVGHVSSTSDAIREEDEVASREEINLLDDNDGKRATAPPSSPIRPIKIRSSISTNPPTSIASASKNRIRRSRKVTDSSDEEIISLKYEENSDVFDPIMKKSPVTQVSYFRSKSENVPVGSSNLNISTINPNDFSRSHSNPDASSDPETTANASLMKRKQRMLAMEPRRRYATTRDYTSITDELECMLPPSDPEKSVKTRIPPSDSLFNAEDTDYQIMESLIQRRLRRNSTNHHNSLEELITRSIHEEESESESSDHSGLAMLERKRKSNKLDLNSQRRPDPSNNTLLPPSVYHTKNKKQS
ncbi:TRPM3 [Lepeophtheirus salmonis]|uniref:TRPM3 n=1 Tax=Lepeophtheirus salmonis TaxID=72036 RepID=A0A7R8HCF9_LEPSM|nr:TRPM3 [Lepeophtheirus salmonis]CAF3007488.1 TRPM3 [Lepeophtheirus salmonis]